MKTTHANLNISEKDGRRCSLSSSKTLAKFKVPAAEQRELIDIVNSTKSSDRGGREVTAMSVNAKELEAKVKEMYRDVATNPHGEFHFEMGRVMAERLGYLPEDLDRIPPEAIESFAGVGYFFHLANLKSGETVVDLGSGSGMDTFVASLKVGANGEVHGVDMTDEQLAKAELLRRTRGFENVSYRKGYIEDTGLETGIADCVISNGVINSPPTRERVPRSGAPAQEGRAARDLGHRHRHSVAAGSDLQR
jgi:SAM-dependent methyltransferase